MIELTDSEFEDIAQLIHENYGVLLWKKRPLVEGRLGFYIESLGFKTYREYLDFATNDPTRKEISNLLNKLTTNHTYFMREEDHFTYYRDIILPWIDKDLKDRDLRIWSAGCSTGQEPYTLSIITQKYIAADAAAWDSRILATDISDKALRIAKTGIYTADELSTVPADWITNFFERESDRDYRVTDRLRKSVIYKRFNLLDPFSIKKPFHTIFCRNVRIYFDTETKEKLVAKFYKALVPGGYLFIGHSESLLTMQNDFTYISPSVYRKD
jgi:chemotaxis protein methyltransferase CheR